MSYLAVDHVTKIYPSLEPDAKKGDEFVVFDEINFTIEKGEFVSMIGHSGCGKSTLLNIMAGFDQATKGGIILDGRETSKPGLDRMVVFQNFALMPWKTAYENVALAVRQSHKEWSKAEVKEWTMKYLQMMNLESAANRRPSMLSGGMRQRVGLARAFAAEPKILLLDEPFAQIDALTRGSIQEELLRMWEATKSTVFMVTHDVDEAILLSNRIAMMSSGPHAKLAEMVNIDIPRPRVRSELIDDPKYMQIRNHIIKFLVSGETGVGDKASNNVAELKAV
ncbi:MAG TPA: bacitracin ABC transporter ATP-binding protein [Opitutae bacterium]|nr:bacitracin ABC transporter ATP-binding protein [Opitutae bacterium]